MTEIIETSREDVVAFKVRGTVDSEDVERVASAVDHALEHRPEVSLLADLDDFEDMTVSGLLSDIVTSLGHASSVLRFDRVGVIGEQAWLTSFEKMAQVLPGVQVKSFTPDQTVDAHAWVAGLLRD